MKQEFALQGLSCDHCVARVEKAISALPGVQKVKVNLKKAQGVVKFDDNQTSSQAIVQAVQTVGYEAIPKN
jgi:copper ion binding protein